MYRQESPAPTIGDQPRALPLAGRRGLSLSQREAIWGYGFILPSAWCTLA